MHPRPFGLRMDALATLRVVRNPLAAYGGSLMAVARFARDGW